MRNRRSLVCVLLAALLSLAFVFPGCSSDNGGDENVLKVGMECGYQPYNWTQLTDEDGAVPIQGRKGQYANGYDVKIAKRIAEGLGKTLQVYAYEWDSLIPAVQSGALDLIIAGMSPTDERKEKVDFSEPYFNSNLVIVVRKDSAYASATTLADFSGAKIVAQSATFTSKPYLRNSSGVPAPFSPNRQLAPQCIRSISGKRPLRYSANSAGSMDANSRVNGTACTFLSEPFRTPIAFRQRTRSSRSMSSGGK